MAARTPTINCHVYYYERNRSRASLARTVGELDEVTGDDMVTAMATARSWATTRATPGTSSPSPVSATGWRKGEEKVMRGNACLHRRDTLWRVT